jgi:hypothetical protein
VAGHGAKGYISPGVRIEDCFQFYRKETKTMPGWTFIRSDAADYHGWAWTDGESQKRYQMQALSDIYRIVQSRLDSYRQSAGAIFLGVIAAVLAFDSGLIRVIMDTSFPPVTYYPVWVVGGFGLLLVSIAFGGAHTIHRIAVYFAEMTAIVYRIDKLNRVWDAGFWIRDDAAGGGEPLFPESFKDAAKVGVGKIDKANGLEGWFDPAIKLFKYFTIALGWVHVIAYGFLVVHGVYSINYSLLQATPATHLSVQPKVVPAFQFYARPMPPIQF